MMGTLLQSPTRFLKHDKTFDFDGNDNEVGKINQAKKVLWCLVD